MNLTCSHRLAEGKEGLCPECEADREEDYLAWMEFGPHPQGEQNWADLQREMAEEAAIPKPPPDTSDVPF